MSGAREQFGSRIGFILAAAGMAEDGTLYLALEKDKAGQPRIFTLAVDEDFFSSNDFATVSEPNLQLPSFTSGNHPINGLALYTHSTGYKGIVHIAR